MPNYPFYLGLDRFIDLDLGLHKPSYPFENIYKKDGKYFIELAVAGFSKSELSIQLYDNKLIVKGKKATNPENRNYIVNNISTRSFSKSWTLYQVKISRVTLVDGILKIELDSIEQEQICKKIEID